MGSDVVHPAESCGKMVLSLMQLSTGIEVRVVFELGGEGGDPRRLQAAGIKGLAPSCLSLLGVGFPLLGPSSAEHNALPSSRSSHKT